MSHTHSCPLIYENRSCNDDCTTDVYDDGMERGGAVQCDDCTAEEPVDMGDRVNEAIAQLDAKSIEKREDLSDYADFLRVLAEAIVSRAECVDAESAEAACDARQKRDEQGEQLAWFP